jgi:hypothetical protein
MRTLAIGSLTLATALFFGTAAASARGHRVSTSQAVATATASATPTATASPTATALPTATPLPLTAGPTIALGTVNGAHVDIVTGGAAAPYEGFQVNVAFHPSSGVTIAGASGAETSLLGSVQCFSAGTLIFGCTQAPSAPTNATGVVGTIGISAKGDGCVTVLLTDSTSVATGTYTVADNPNGLPWQRSVRQQNTVGTNAAHVLIGAGALADCP